MREVYRRVAAVLACALVLCLIAGVAYAELRVVKGVPTYGTTPTYFGWTKAMLFSAKGDLSAYIQPAKGSPGPAPCGNFWFQAGQNGGGDGNPGQSWMGTDIYGNGILYDTDGNGEVDFDAGPRLDEITELSYWAILDFRGGENRQLLFDNGMNDPGEYQLEFLSSQPPQMQIFIKKNINETAGNMRSLIYRPWDMGFTDSHKGFGPKDGSRCRKWQKFDCLNQGYWYDPFGGPVEIPESPGTYTYMKTWQEVLAAYPNAVLKTPSYDNSGAFSQYSSPTGAAVNFVLGARTLTNNQWPDNGAWWQESWNAIGAIDKFKIAYTTATTGSVEHEYDFEHATYGKDGAVVRALNNRAMLDAPFYMPVPRTRANVPWGGGTVVAAKMNAIQRAGNYNYSTETKFDPILGANRTFYYATLFVLYGKVVGPYTNDVTFNVDDGSGKIIKVYCADGAGVLENQYVRMQGTCYVMSPYEWHYNNFHRLIAGQDEPLVHGFDPEFHTYSWNVTTLGW